MHATAGHDFPSLRLATLGPQASFGHDAKFPQMIEMNSKITMRNRRQESDVGVREPTHCRTCPKSHVVALTNWNDQKRKEDTLTF
jgi:hypothetical protein